VRVCIRFAVLMVHPVIQRPLIHVSLGTKFRHYSPIALHSSQLLASWPDLSQLYVSVVSSVQLPGCSRLWFDRFTLLPHASPCQRTHRALRVFVRLPNVLNSPPNSFSLITSP
jgi:hypothetical protein